ncbi:class I SAM-dependent methyltransferase [Thalassospiraceae bacterium LMO-JJ14]|nr:class I SAM-dependent methyltransferase [Thalassospiraceae bacterium LMO-JJ14]
MTREARWPVPCTLTASIVAAGAALAIWGFAPAEFPRSHTTLLGLAFFAGILAVVIGRIMHLGTAWLVLCAIATPALVLVPVYQPPVWIFPAIVLVLAGFYINGVREQVPLYLSNAITEREISALFERAGGRLFIDLGCGLGGVVAAVAKSNTDARVIGVETAPLSFLVSWLRIAALGRQTARIQFRSIWDTDVSDADAVYAFLSPAPMARLYEKLKTEMKPGSLFISNSFAVPGGEPDEIVQVDDSRQTQLLIWRM